MRATGKLVGATYGLRPQWTAGAFVLALFLLHPARTAAQTPPDPQRLAGAQTLYEAAVSDLQRGDPKAACPKLEEVIAIEPAGLGARLTLAQCYERSGRLASAWVTYKLVEAEAARVGQPERKERAAEAALALTSKLAGLTLQVPPEVRAMEGLTISRDGAKLGPSQWEGVIPVDAGVHLIQVTAKGRGTWEQSVVSVDGATQVLRVQAPPFLPAEPQAAESPKGGAPIAATSGRGIPKPGEKAQGNSGAPTFVVPRSFWDIPRAVGVAGCAFGLFAGVTAGVNFGVAVQKKESTDTFCNDKGDCTKTGFSRRSEAFASGNVATAFTIAGAVGAVGGLALILFWPRAQPPSAVGGRAAPVVARTAPGAGPAEMTQGRSPRSVMALKLLPAAVTMEVTFQ